ncbi:MAG: cardiolipin synthase [Candidatus Absconditabacteria bacterium]|nr:cardiolipin synthase [Candidatus Absconditabacteria bacterium]MDD3868272.1 cardiolipin synthase [Candidatus Absconditabacteria bacterium]MDD4714600.1 cardiolipin synthase [Candidatus Absconditabacteria bacterium]
MESWWYYLIYFAYGLTILHALFAIISENRNPIRTLARVLILVFLPLVGIICYHLFGGEDRKAKKILRTFQKRLKKNPFRFDIQQDTQQPEENYQSLAHLIEEGGGSSLRAGSEITILQGKEKLDQLLQDIQQAQHHIHMEYYIFENDKSGNLVKQALMKRAQEGVKVRFLYDNVAGRRIPPRFYNEMKKAGILVCPFMKVSFPAFKSKINYRNHKKLAIIDGKIGYIGGMNIGDRYFYDPTRKDAHLRIHGHGVYGIQTEFVLDRLISEQKDIKDVEYFFPDMEKTSENLFQIVSGGPNFEQKTLLLATIQIVSNTKKYLYIQTPYFLPTEGLINALKIVAMSGIDVRIMLSRHSDSPFVHMAAQSYYRDLLQVGVKIYEHETCFIHAKTLVADDYLSSFGSMNMDFRSFEYNFECNCYLYDQQIAKEQKSLFEKDIKDCKEILLEQRQKRSKIRKVTQSIVRLFAPLM